MANGVFKCENFIILRYCVGFRKAVILHSEIRDVHQSPVDVYYLFVQNIVT